MEQCEDSLIGHYRTQNTFLHPEKQYKSCHWDGTLLKGTNM